MQCDRISSSAKHNSTPSRFAPPLPAAKIMPKYLYKFIQCQWLAYSRLTVLAHFLLSINIRARAKYELAFSAWVVPVVITDELLSVQIKYLKKWICCEVKWVCLYVWVVQVAKWVEAERGRVDVVSRIRRECSISSALGSPSRASAGRLTFKLILCMYTSTVYSYCSTHSVHTSPRTLLSVLSSTL